MYSSQEFLYVNYLFIFIFRSRRNRDSNPGYNELYDRLAIYCFRPLSHFSENKVDLERNRWLWWDLNLRPWAYESPALTTELQSLGLLLSRNSIIF